MASDICLQTRIRWADCRFELIYECAHVQHGETDPCVTYQDKIPPCSLLLFSQLSGLSFAEVAIERLLLSACSQTCLHPRKCSSSGSQCLTANLYQISTLILGMSEDQHHWALKDGHDDTKTHLMQGMLVKASLHGFLLRLPNRIHGGGKTVLSKQDYSCAGLTGMPLNISSRQQRQTQSYLSFYEN